MKNFSECNCPLIDRVCDKENCVAYEPYLETTYETPGTEEHIIRIPKKIGKHDFAHEYRIIECIIDKKVDSHHHHCRQYKLNGVTIKDTKMNVPYTYHGENSWISYNESRVNVRNDNRNKHVMTPDENFEWKTETTYSKHYKETHNL